MPSVASLDEQPHIIEFGAAIVENGAVVRKYNQLINPGMEISKEITKITGIKNEDLVGKPSFKDVADDILALFDGTDDAIAHNVEFDNAMIINEFRRIDKCDVKLPMLVCTVQEFSFLFGRRMNLAELYKHFTGKELRQTHRAIDDVTALVEALQAAKFWG